MRATFDEEIADLHESFAAMGRMVSQNIKRAVDSFVDHDKDSAGKVIDYDPKINELEVQLEKTCFELIALQQPVTSDLRRIVTVMKASSDLERMGDHAVSIAKATIKVKGTTRVYEIEEAIGQMGDVVLELVDQSLHAYRHEDEQKAIFVAKKDDEINELSRRIHKRIVEEMKKDAETILGNTYYMLVTSYLERIGDYATNLCEWVVYLKTGKIVELNNNVRKDTV